MVTKITSDPAVNKVIDALSLREEVNFLSDMFLLAYKGFQRGTDGFPYAQTNRYMESLNRLKVRLENKRETLADTVRTFSLSQMNQYERGIAGC